MLLGIDIGTSGVKTTVVDVTGSVHAHAYRPFTTYGAKEGKRELNPLEVEEKSFEAVREVLAETKQEKIELITISSLGEAVVPVAKDGTVLMNSIIGSDPRGSVELKALCHVMGEETLTQITGLNLSYIYSLNKILYVKKHYPHIHDRVWKYMCFTDYMGYLLTGNAIIDYSMASRTLAFDYQKKAWSKEILETAQIPESIFSKPVQGGSLIGEISSGAKKKMGISYEVPVMVGSHDHIFNAIGAGVVRSGVCSNTVGTTEGITAVLDRTMPAQSIQKNNISCEPFVKADMYNTVAWHNTAGAMVNWYLQTFYQESSKSRGELLNGLNKTVSDHPSSLMVLPHFSGATAKYMDEKAKGCILGLTVTTSREEIYKAVLEGASYEFRMIYDSILEAGITLDQIIVSGGGSNSLPWLKIKADILGETIYKSACVDTGALGGAVLGAWKLGKYTSLEKAARAMIKTGTAVEPNMKNHEIYKERYCKYKELYIKLKDLNHLLF